MLSGALACVAAGAGLTTAMTSLWQLAVLWGPVIGIATGANSVPPSAIVANRWFVRRRGLVTGLLTAAFATGNLAFPPLLAWITGAHGWRWAAAVVTVASLAVIPVVALLMRDRPADVGLRPYGAPPGFPPDAALPPAGNPFTLPLRVLRDAARARGFRLRAGTFFVCGGPRTAPCSRTSSRPRTTTTCRR